MAPENTPPPTPGFDELLEDEEIFQDEVEVEFDEAFDDEDDDGGGQEEVMETPPEENSEIVFPLHERPVFTGHFHPSKPICVTGGEDNRAFVWNWKTGASIMETPEFKDSVIFTKFNKDGGLLAMGDMAGSIKVYKMHRDTPKDVIWNFELCDITWMNWHHSANVLFAGTIESELWMWKVPSNQGKIYMGHGKRVECAKLLPDGKRIVVGYDDGIMKLFDLKSSSTLHNITGDQSHYPAMVTCMDVRSDNNLMASGGFDSTAKIFNCHSGKNIASLFHGSAGRMKTEPEDGSESSKTSVEAALFSSPEQNLLITGTSDGMVYVWDVSSHGTRHSVDVGGCVVKIAWRNSSSPHLLVATAYGNVCIVDYQAGKIVGKCSGHTDAVLDLSQTSDGVHVLTCSDDGTCRVFDVEKVLSGFI